MRLLTLGATLSFLLTVVTAGALRAADAAVAVVAVAALTVLLTWYARLHTTDEESSLGLVSPASALTLATVGRRPWSTLLPLLAAHAIGSVLGGLAALGLGDRWGELLLFDSPTLLVAGLGAAVVGLLTAWVALALDAGGSDAFAAVPVLVAGGLLPLGLVATFSPSVVLGLATADVLTWDVALVAAGASLLAAAIGGLTVGLLLPDEQ